MPPHILTYTFLAVFCFLESVLATNLISDPTFKEGWISSASGDVHDTQFNYAPFGGAETALGIESGRDRQGRWTTTLGLCEPGAPYRFEADFYRENRSDPLAYPEVRFWGETHRLNTHRMFGKYQRLFVETVCPESAAQKKGEFSFINSYPDNMFWMKNPRLVKITDAPIQKYTPPQQQFFPIAAYGANAANLATIKQSGLNSAVLRLSRENVEACLDLDLHCTVSTPRDPRKLTEVLDELEPLLRKGEFAFYVNDEPGIHSFPKEKAENIQRIIKERFPDSFTNMAIVRPQVVPEYAYSADYFMLDQYPIPTMPMVWLSESMDEAAAHVGRDRLQSVIQAFGGGPHAGGGWPRLPTYEEMNNLAFLSLVHGSRGIYFFTYSQIAADETGKGDFERVIARLNSLRSWLVQENLERVVPVRMTSRYKCDPSGNPAVHCAEKEQYGTRLLMCVNTLGTFVEAEVDVEAGRSLVWEDYFLGDEYYVVDGNVLLRFGPFGVLVLMEVL